MPHVKLHYQHLVSVTTCSGMYGQAEDLVEKIKADETVRVYAHTIVCQTSQTAD